MRHTSYELVSVLPVRTVSIERVIMATSMLGFDIGTSQLKIVHWNGTSVVKMVSADMPDNMIKNDAIISYDAMADFIKEVLKAHGLKEKKAALILPAQFTFLRRLTVPYMSEEQMRVNLPYEFKDFLNDNKDKYYYDYIINEIVKDEEEKPREMDIFASAVLKSVIEDYRGMFRRAGLKLLIGVPQEIPYVNLLKAKNVEKTSECAILDLGYMSTKLDIFTGSAFDTSRVIEMGLKDVDLAIAESENVDEHVAGGYKIADHNGCQTCEQAKAVYASIAADVRKAVNFYSFSNRESNLSDLYICGGGANIPELVRTIGETLSELTIHDIRELLPETKDEEANPSQFVQAAGVSLQSPKTGTDTLNVVIKEKSPLPVGRTIIGVVLVLAAAACFSQFLVYNRLKAVDEARAEVARVRAQHDSYINYLTDYDDVAAEYARYSIGWMTDTEKNRVDRSRILEIIQTEIAPRATVTEISITENTATVDVTECSLSMISEIVAELLDLEDVASVKMSSATSEDSQNDLEGATIIFNMVGRGGTK